MAQNITLMGASYSAVPSVLLPKTGGGTAQFDDTTISSNAAAASDITQNKQAWVNGVLVTGTNSGGGSSKNVQILQSTTRTNSTSYTKLCGDITVAKTGTYDVYWTYFRSSTSGTWGSQLYIDGSAYGSKQTTYSNHISNVHLSNVSLTQGDKIAVYGRSRGNSYYAYVGQLTIIES